MAETTLAQDATAPRKRSLLPLIMGLFLAFAGGGAGFYATWSGLLFGPSTTHADRSPTALPDIAYVPIEPLFVTLPPGGRSKHLRFTAQLEVEAQYKSDVTLLLPRVMDLLNGFLRAVEPADLEEPAALIRLRAQMLRRVQMVTGEGRVRDLLITEFILN